jgi:hypothetical protein
MGEHNHVLLASLFVGDEACVLTAGCYNGDVDILFAESACCRATCSLLLWVSPDYSLGTPKATIHVLDALESCVHNVFMLTAVTAQNTQQSNKTIHLSKHCTDSA